jgi:homoserine kinase
VVNPTSIPGRARAFAPGGVGNVGPGFDVLGLAVDGLGDTVSIELTNDRNSRIEMTGVDWKFIPLDPLRNACAIAARFWLDRCGVNQSFRMSIVKGIPMSAGLGGSGASSVAGALAAALACGSDATPIELMEAALAGESFVAGRHLDNIAASVLGGLALVRSIDPIDAIRLPISGDWRIVLVTPHIRLSTKRARAILPAASDRKVWVQEMANSVGLAHAFASGDSSLMRRCLDDVYAEPHRSALIPHFDAVKRAALDAGAHGCSISGAGPTLFAIADDASAAAIGSAMKNAFAEIESDVRVARIAADGARPLGPEEKRDG